MSSDIDQLARLLQRPTETIVHHRGKVTAVDTIAKTCAVDYAGGNAPGVPYFSGLTIAVNDRVDLLIVGVAPRVIGVIQ